MKLRIAVLVLALMTAFAPVMPAAADALDQAKAQGLVGETAGGYLDVVKGDGSVRQMVDQINLQRKQNYRDIARKNNTTLEVVEAIVGQKLLIRAKPGEFIKGTDGRWVRK